jgi:GH25 family lysozyme M1 (1,4-beta-N-acetylmuramidase)
MALYGVDISMHQKGIDVSKLKNTSFIIVKATEGYGYTDPCFSSMYNAAKSSGKLLGTYYFARPKNNNPYDDATYYVREVKKVCGSTSPIYILDWEKNPIGDTAWAKKWLDKVAELTGTVPWIYMNLSCNRSYNWEAVASKYPLWLACYPVSAELKNYDMSKISLPSVKYWVKPVMWQFTSHGKIDGFNSRLDCNIFYGDKADWEKYAKPASKSSGKKATNTADYGYDNLVFGMHHLNITQLGTLIDGKKHLSHSNAALDLAGSDSDKDFYYAKSRMKCIGQWKPGYGTYFFSYVDASGNYTKMHLADGTDKYVVLAMTHSSQQYVKTTVGKIYEVDSPVYEEGGLGKNGATTHGNHIHLEIAVVDSVADMPKTKAWDSSVGCYRMKFEANPLNCFFILDGYTTVVSTNGAKFKHVSSVKNIKAADTADKGETVYLKPLKLGANVRSAPVNGKVLATIPKGGRAKIVSFTGEFASDGYEWARVEYNGTTGYSQLDTKYYVIEG